MVLQKQLKIEAGLIFILGFFAFTFGLAGQEIIGFEARFYLFALEAFRHGISLFPTTYGQPYPDYPVTSTALIKWTAELCGMLNKFTAVAPSAIAGSLTLVGTYLIGATHNKKLGFLAVCFLFLTVAFITEARTISLDLYVTAVTTFVFYIAYTRPFSNLNVFKFFIPLFFVGFLFRGPIGLIIPAGVISLFYLFDKKYTDFFKISFAAVMVLITSTLIFFWIAYVTGGESLIQKVLQAEVLTRLKPIKTPPLYYYFFTGIAAYAITYPISLLIFLRLFPLFFKKILSPELNFLKKCFIWIFVILIGLSIPADKKMRYILALSPALALTTASLFVFDFKSAYLKWIKTICYALCIFIPLCALIFLLKHNPLYGLIKLNTVIIIYLVLTQVLILLMFFYRKTTGVIFLGALSSLVMMINIVEPINIALNKTADFVTTVESIRNAQNASLVFYREDADGLPIKYMANMTKDALPQFVENSKEIKKNSIIITSDEHGEELKNANIQKLLTGKIGHDAVVVFNKV